MSFMEQAESGTIGRREHEVRGADITFEFMLNAFRLPAGFTAPDYTDRTGLPIETIADGLEVAEARGMIRSFEGSKWQPTTLGLRFQNDLTAIFLP